MPRSPSRLRVVRLPQRESPIFGAFTGLATDSCDSLKLGMQNALLKMMCFFIDAVETMPKDAIRMAYECDQGKWTGCNWRTSFGPRELNLSGIRCRQARILANATSGDESKAWREAADWLDRVERDAAEAEADALCAVNFAAAGLFDEAEVHALRACDLGRKYDRLIVWNELHQAIQLARSKSI